MSKPHLRSFRNIISVHVLQVCILNTEILFYGQVMQLLSQQKCKNDENVYSLKYDCLQETIYKPVQIIFRAHGKEVDF